MLSRMVEPASVPSYRLMQHATKEVRSNITLQLLYDNAGVRHAVQ